MVITLRALLFASAIAVLNTCSESPTAPRTPVTSVSLVGPGLMYLGRSSQFQALAHDHAGNLITGRAVTWASDSPSVASIDTAGLVASHAVGVATVSATVDGVKGVAILAVILPPISQVIVTPPRDSAFVGDSIQLSVAVRDVDGPIETGRTILWSVSDTAKASVTAAGLVRVRAPGGVAIRANCDTAHGGAFINGQLHVLALYLPDTITVPRYHSVRVFPALESTSGGELGDRAVAWTSLDTTVFTVSDSGVVTPRGYGAGRLTAAVETSVDSSLVVVDPEPIASLGLPTSLGPLYRDSTITILATGFDADGRVVPQVHVSWSANDTGIVRVRPDSANSAVAHVTGLAFGTAIISVAAGSKILRVGIDVTLAARHLELVPDSAVLRVGEQLSVVAFMQDSESHEYGFYLSPTYSMVDTTIAQINITQSLITARGPGRTLLIGSNNGFVDTMPIVVRPASYRLTWAGPGIVTTAYVPAQALISVVDSTGQPTPTGHDANIRSSDTTVAVVSPTQIVGLRGGALVTIRGVRTGTTSIWATTDSAVSSELVTVTLVPVGSIAMTPRPPAVLREGDTLRIAVVMRGADSVARPYPVAWASSDTAVATVTDSGVVTARRGGVTQVTATSGSLHTALALTVESLLRPVIDSATPQILVPDADVTLLGSGFDPDPAHDTVTVDGVPATVLAAQESTLTVALPAAGSFPCRATHWATILVNANGRVVRDSLPLETAVQTQLSPGDARTLSAADGSCMELAQTGGTYLVSVSNAAATPEATAGFVFAGDTATALQGPPASSPAAPAIADAAGLRQALKASSAMARATARAPAHRQLLERNRTFLRQAGSPLAALRARRGALRPALSANDTIGAVAAFRVPDLSNPFFCGAYTTITARRVWTGIHAVIFEDVAAPLAGVNDINYSRIGTEFDLGMYPRLLANFGDPLAMDSLLDANGRLVMLFTPLVDRYGAEGFVVSCDFFPESVAPSSNTGEVFYARVPTVAGFGYNDDTADEWYREIRTVVMHESKHLTAYAERLAHGRAPEETWLEEATAVTAEEIWARTIYGNTWKGNATYQQTLYCDVRPTTCGRPYSMFNAFAFLYDYALARVNRSPLGPTASSDATFYGSGWSLVRWAIDQYAGDEGQFLHALIDEPTLSGIDNLAARAGQPADRLIAQWPLAAALDDGTDTVATTWSVPSWNQRDIFAGMHADFPSFFATATPFLPTRVGFQAFAFQVAALPGGGSVAYQLAGQQRGKELLHLAGLGGGAAPAGLRVQLLRVH